MREALQRDPDNISAQTKLKKLRRLVTDMANLKEAIKEAMSRRLFEQAAVHCSEALRIAEDDKGLCAPLHAERAKAYQRLARSRSRGETRSEREKQAGADMNAMAAKARDEVAPPEEEKQEDPRAGSNACWRRCLQDCGSAIYAEPTLKEP